MLTFDGKFVYEGIDRVTNNFDDEHCIGKDGQGVVTKLRYHLEKLLRQEISFTTSR